jgi:hypothetical protein
LATILRRRLLEDERIGFVDIGWRGTLQDAIFKILKSKS